MLNNIKNYCLDEDFRFNFENNKLDIINYKEIISLEDDKIILLSTLGRITIKGNNLTVKRLLDQEILIAGLITSIEIGA